MPRLSKAWQPLPSQRAGVERNWEADFSALEQKTVLLDVELRKAQSYTNSARRRVQALEAELKELRADPGSPGCAL